MSQPDAEYRESGVEWLRRVPQHWGVARLCDAAELINGHPFDSELFDQAEGIPLVRIRDLFSLETEVRWSGEAIPNAEIGNGDVLIGMDGDFNVAWWTQGPALLNQRLCCARTLPAHLNQRFLFYCLPFPLKALNDVTYATTVKHLSSLDVLKFRLPLPPPDEQLSIVEFLDRETGRIDALVEKKRLLSERLEEYRTALITRTVTRGLPGEAARAAGLDPSPRLKPSGVEWLGDVPEHWETTRLARVITCLDGRRIPLNAEQRADFQGEHPYWGANGVLDYVAGWLFDEPLVLLGEDGAPFFDANKRVAFSVSGKIWVNNHAHVLRPTGIHPEFLTHLLNTTEFAFFIDGSTRDKLTQGQMNSIPVPVPPLNEQREISKFLHQRTGQIDRLVKRVETNIERLREHRIALITAAVTGKINVRESGSAPVVAT